MSAAPTKFCSLQCKGNGFQIERSGLRDNWDDAEGYYGKYFFQNIKSINIFNYKKCQPMVIFPFHCVSFVVYARDISHIVI